MVQHVFKYISVYIYKLHIQYSTNRQFEENETYKNYCEHLQIFAKIDSFHLWIIVLDWYNLENRSQHDLYNIYMYLQWFISAIIIIENLPNI